MGCGVVSHLLWDCKFFSPLFFSRIFNQSVILMFGRVAAAEGFFIYRADWDQAVEDAQDRNAAG